MCKDVYLYVSLRKNYKPVQGAPHRHSTARIGSSPPWPKTVVDDKNNMNPWPQLRTVYKCKKLNFIVLILLPISLKMGRFLWKNPPKQIQESFKDPWDDDDFLFEIHFHFHLHCYPFVLGGGFTEWNICMFYFVSTLPNLGSELRHIQSEEKMLHYTLYYYLLQCHSIIYNQYTIIPQAGGISCLCTIIFL